jgi:hypothetical protein
LDPVDVPVPVPLAPVMEADAAEVPVPLEP